jgi:hypothetical protein
MTLDAPFILQVLIALCSGAGAYAAIRADLARLHERAQNAMTSAAQAHQRIDTLLNK